MERRGSVTKSELGRELIVRAPEIQGGEPVIRGTRVPVRSIVLSHRYDYSGNADAVAAAYDVDVAAVEAALAYYREHKAEIDDIIDRNERAAHEV